MNRTRPVSYTHLPVGGLFPVARRAFAAPSGAVSYTHLDVYKRQAFPTPVPPDPQNGGERGDLKAALNILSSALYVMQCKFVGGHYGVRRKPGPLKGWRPPAKS